MIPSKTLNWPETCHASLVAQLRSHLDTLRIFPGAALPHLEPPRVPQVGN